MNRRQVDYCSMITLFIGLGAGCTTPSVCPVQNEVSSPTLASSALQQKVKEQDKRIAELSIQLNLLKRIDQDRKRDR